MSGCNGREATRETWEVKRKEAVGPVWMFSSFPKNEATYRERKREIEHHKSIQGRESWGTRGDLLPGNRPKKALAVLGVKQTRGILSVFSTVNSNRH